MEEPEALPAALVQEVGGAADGPPPPAAVAEPAVAAPVASAPAQAPLAAASAEDDDGVEHPNALEAAAEAEAALGAAPPPHVPAAFSPQQQGDVQAAASAPTPTYLDDPHDAAEEAQLLAQAEDAYPPQEEEGLGGGQWQRTTVHEAAGDGDYLLGARASAG